MGTAFGVAWELEKRGRKPSLSLLEIILYFRYATLETRSESYRTIRKQYWSF